MMKKGKMTLICKSKKKKKKKNDKCPNSWKLLVNSFNL